MIDPRAIRTFLAVVHGNSISGRARRLNISQPSVSNAIAQLEQSLGVSLFEAARNLARDRWQRRACRLPYRGGPDDHPAACRCGGRFLHPVPKTCDQRRIDFACQDAAYARYARSPMERQFSTGSRRTRTGRNGAARPAGKQRRHGHQICLRHRSLCQPLNFAQGGEAARAAMDRPWARLAIWPKCGSMDRLRARHGSHPTASTSASWQRGATTRSR